MAAIKGRDILLKVNTTGTTYVNLAGLRQKSLKFNNGSIDITNSDSPDEWRELMAGGVRSFEFSGSGVFVDDAGVNKIITDLLEASATRTLTKFQVIVPSLGTFQADFLITSLDLGGDHDKEGIFSMAAASSGALTFTAAA